MDAVYEILQEKPLSALTMEEIARRAGVGKPTLYKWWPSKSAIVIDMFTERIVPSMEVPDGPCGEEVIRAQVRVTLGLLGGFFGKVSAEIIAEGQCDGEVLREYVERYVRHRRAMTVERIARAQASGEFKREIDPQVLIDMIYGPIYYRLLVKHQPLDQRFGEELLDHIMAYLKA